MVAKSVKLVTSFLNSSALTRPLMVLGAVSAAWGGASAQSVDPSTLPQGANVVGGNATVQQAGNALNINQSSNRTVIDWRSFDIGSSAQVNFSQPGTSSIAVNRVNNSANPTQIQGGLHANGQVWILNPNGVYFGSTARVDAAGVVATTANIDVNQFMAGSNRLQMTGADHGSVTNAGSITVGESGLAAFVAPSVRNSGTINAKVGKVTLAAGTTYTLDLAGDRLVEIGLGSVNAVVDQSGKIVNPGGTVALTAKAASQVVNSVVNVSGVVDASSVKQVGGNIVLGGDDITTTSSAVLAANGGSEGNGGAITAVADHQGNYAGTFSAKGGATSGDGGKIETSGKTVSLAKDVKVDTSAPHGATGAWSIDPIDLVVGDSEAAAFVGNLATTNTSITASNSITVNSTIDSSAQTNSNTLTLADEDANGLLTVNLNAAIKLGANQHLTGQANLVNVASTGLIQNGIDVALAGGATVNVAAGTYNESVVINKAGLTLQSTVLHGAIIDAGGQAVGIKIANNAGNLGTITVDGFTVQNWTSVGIAQGMSAGPYATVRVLNNVVNGPAGGATANGNGIQVSGNGSLVSGNQVHFVHLNSTDWSGSGIIAVNGSNITVENNSVDNADIGIAVTNWDNTAGMSNIVIKNNTVSHSGNEGISVEAFEGEAYSTPSGGISGLTITNNTVTDSVSGLGIWDYSPSKRGTWAGTLTNVSGNNFARNTYQISSDFTGANVLSLVGTNSFDRTVVNTAAAGTIYGDLQKAIDTEAAGSTLNLAGTFSGGVTVNKDGDTLDGQNGTVFSAGGSTSSNVITVTGDNVTVRNLEIDLTPTGSANINGVAIADSADHATVTGLTIRGEITGSYIDYGFGNAISRGVAVSNGATNFLITKNDIRNVRNGILIDGRNTGTVTGNTIDNTKSAVSVQYTDAGLGNTEGYGVSITGNYQGTYGNEWGVNFHLNGHCTAPCTSGPVGTKIATTATDSVQAALLANSAANGGWTVQDQGYSLSNRTAVVVGTSGSDANQGSPRGTLATIQAGIDAVVSGGTVNINNGIYVVSSGYINVGKSLSLIGQSEAGVIIDARSASTYGLRVTALNNVTLKNFTLYGVTAASSYGLKAEGTNNLTLANITSQGAGKSEFDFNRIVNGTFDNLTANGASVATGLPTDGNGISFTDSQHITLTNSTTSNNAWGGLALYQHNVLSETDINVGGTNTFTELNPVYAQDESSTLDFGTINLSGLGFSYIGQNRTATDGFYTFFQKTEQGALDVVVSKGVATASVQGYSGTNLSGNNIFTVGTSSIGPALSINAAINAASSGATINVLAGTYSGFGTSFGGPANLTIQTTKGAVIDATGVPTYSRIIDLRADGTTISGFTINGAGNGVGISISGKGVTASGNTINNVLTGVQTTTQYATGNATITGNIITAAYGVSLQNAGNTVTGNTVTASTEGVGLIYSANTTFSNNTFTIGAKGHALNFVDSVSAGGLTASGNIVNVAGGDLQGAAYLAGTKGALNLAAGSYTLGSTLLISNNGLTVKGAGEGATTITSTASGYGINVTANDVTLSSFSYNGNPSGTYSVKVSPSGAASSRVLNFAIDHVTINGSKNTGLDLNGVKGATIDHVTVTNTAKGNGISLTDSANVTITNTTTSNNAWGGLALYQSNFYYDQQVTDISVDATNTFNEAIPVYLEDQSDGIGLPASKKPSVVGGSGLDFGTLSIAGFDYAVRSPNAANDVYTWLQTTQQKAIDFATSAKLGNGNVNVSTAVVEGWTGASTDDIYTVGVSTGGQAMSINAAANASAAGATINVLDGTYAEDVAIGSARILNLGTVTVGSLTLDAGAAGTQISGKLAGGTIALNGAVTLAGDLTLDTSANNGSIVVAGVDGTTAGAQALTLKAGTGTVSLGDVGATTQLGAVSDINTTTLTGSTYTADSLDIGALTLAKDVVLAANSITVASVDGTTAGAQALALKAGSVSLGDVGATTRLGAVSDANKTTLTGSTYTAGSLDLGALTLTKDTTLNAATIAVASVDGTTAGGQALTLNGAASLGDVGATTRLGAVSDASATTLTGSTYAANSLGFGALTLAKDATLDTTANNGSIVLASVDGTAAGAQALTLKSGTGSVSLGDVGATTRLGAVSDANKTTLTGSTYAANSLGFGALTLAKDATLDTSANNGTIVVASANGTTAGAQALTLKSGTGLVSLGDVGATTRLGAVSDASTTTLTGSAYTAKSFTFSRNVTLTSATTTLDTSAAAGNITFAGNIFGTAAGGQSLVLTAGSGRGATSTNGNISLQNVGTQAVRLNNLSVSGNGFGALTVALAGNFVSQLTGNQVFAADTLDALGSVNSTVGGSASGHIAASGAVTFGVTGDLSGTISGGAITLTTGSLTNSTITGTGSLVVASQGVTGAVLNAPTVTVTSSTLTNSTITGTGSLVVASSQGVTGVVLNAPTVTVTAGTFDGTVTATNTASIQAATIGGTFTAGTVTLAATDTVNAAVTADTLNMSASKGDVNGTWTTVNTTGTGTLVVNGETNLGNSGANPNQLVVEGFALPLGTQVRASGEIVLPQGMVLGLLSPGGASTPRVIVVHDVRRLGELLEAGYVAIIMDLSGREKDKETQLASN
jgi:filamentous hemagglutinin family protein